MQTASLDPSDLKPQTAPALAKVLEYPKHCPLPQILFPFLEELWYRPFNVSKESFEQFLGIRIWVLVNTSRIWRSVPMGADILQAQDNYRDIFACDDSNQAS